MEGTCGRRSGAGEGVGRRPFVLAGEGARSPPGPLDARLAAGLAPRPPTFHSPHHGHARHDNTCSRARGEPVSPAHARDLPPPDLSAGSRPREGCAVSHVGVGTCGAGQPPVASAHPGGLTSSPTQSRRRCGTQATEGCPAPAGPPRGRSAAGTRERVPGRAEWAASAALPDRTGASGKRGRAAPGVRCARRTGWPDPTHGRGARRKPPGCLSRPRTRGGLPGKAGQRVVAGPRNMRARRAHHWRPRPWPRARMCRARDSHPKGRDRPDARAGGKPGERSRKAPRVWPGPGPPGRARHSDKIFKGFAVSSLNFCSRCVFEHQQHPPGLELRLAQNRGVTYQALPALAVEGLSVSLSNTMNDAPNRHLPLASPQQASTTRSAG